MAQLAPVVGPRAVVNAFTREPAASTVAPGGLIWINGLNFSSLTDTKVFVNNVTARVLLVSTARLVVQVLPETASGLAEVVVQLGDTASPERGTDVIFTFALEHFASELFQPRRPGMST